MAGVEWTYAILRRSIPAGEKHWIDPYSQLPVILTPALQLMGAHAALEKFRKAYKADYGRITGDDGRSPRRAWESHHIVEGQDLTVLRSLGLDIPDYEICPAVLLPPEAHRNRVNRNLPRGANRMVADLRGYAEAYSLIGNYTSAGAKAIRDELLAVCRAIIVL